VYARPTVALRTMVRSARLERRLVACVTVSIAGVMAGIIVVQVAHEGLWAHQAIAALGGIALTGVGVSMLRGFTLVEIYCVVLIWVSTFSALLREVNVGPVSANGAWTLVAIVAGGLLWLTSPRQRGLSILSPLIYFAIQGAVYLIIFPRFIPGIQSVLAVFAFIVCIAVVASSGQHLRSLVRKLTTTFARVSWIAIGMYGATIAIWGLGNDDILGPRGFALLALIPLTWNLARWRYGDRSSAVRSLGLLGAILLSLSRLATGIGLLLWPLSRTSSRPSIKAWGRVAALSLASVGVFVVAIEVVSPLRDRFVQGDVESVGGLSINVTGRDDVWPVVWQSALTSPWIGQGAGSAEIRLLEHGFRVSHPHNEYIRILHDFGLVGALLWMWGFAVLLGRTFSAWRLADRAGNPDAYIHLAAWLGLVSLALGMITDNPLRYVHVLLPLGLTVGSSLGLMATTDEVIDHETSGSLDRAVLASATAAREV
jgi:O-antigen ligase/polysaccharide polymerase Wzy-like membrane protein